VEERGRQTRGRCLDDALSKGESGGTDSMKLAMTRTMAVEMLELAAFTGRDG
jgi:hypothetical protein